MPHKDPDNAQEYWAVRKARGRFGSLMQYYLYKRSLFVLFLKFIAKDFWFLLKFVTIILTVIHVARIARYSKTMTKDFFIFYVAYTVQEVARIIGEWEGWLMALRSPDRTNS